MLFPPLDAQMSNAKQNFADYTSSLEDFKTKMYEDAVDSLASLYLANGDVQVKDVERIHQTPTLEPPDYESQV